jgi:HlyD family secretion protein
VQQAQIDKAQQDVKGAESNRDAVCGMTTSTRAQCEAARSSVEGGAAALVVVQASTKQTAAQNAQAVQSSQTLLDQANGAVQVAHATLAANQARNQAPLQTAQAQVDSASGALQTARDALATDQARQQVALQASQQQANQALGLQQAARATADSNAARDMQALAQARQSADQARAGLLTAQAQATQTATRGTVSVHTAQGQASQAASQLSTLQAQLAQTTAQPSEADLAAAKALVAGAQVAVDQAKANLAAATLVAPADGTVAQINGVVGQLVSATGTAGGSSPGAFVSLADLDQLQVQAQVNESDMAGIRSDNAVTFTVSAYPGTTFSGHVLTVQPMGNQSQSVVTYSVVCSVDRTEVPLLPGMTASLTLVADSRSDVALVPLSAVQFAQSQGAPPGTVLVMTNGTLTPRTIKTGLTDGRMAEVVSGVQTSELVATSLTGR